jgi:hypothetical protein
MPSVPPPAEFRSADRLKEYKILIHKDKNLEFAPNRSGARHGDPI